MKSKPQKSRKERIQQMRRNLEMPQHPSLKTASGHDLDQEERVLNYLTMLESDPSSTLAKQLIEDGVELPPPGNLNGDEVRGKLWEVIHAMVGRRHYITHTDHLSDIELYEKLWTETLNEAVQVMDDSMGKCATHWELADYFDEDSDEVYMKYYADDWERELWREVRPGEKPPGRVDPPHDRDRLLPQFGI